MSPLLAVFWNLGVPELIVVAIVVLLLFGNRLPGLMRSLGRGVVEFKKGVQGIDDESNSAGAGMNASDREPTPVDSAHRS